MLHNGGLLNVNRGGCGHDGCRGLLLYSRGGGLRDLLAGRGGALLLQLRHRLRQLLDLLLLRLNHVVFVVAAGQGKSAQHG